MSVERGQSLRIAPIAADLRFGSVRVKGRGCSIARDAGGFVLPTISSLLFGAVSALKGSGPWFDLNRAQGPSTITR
jgi:hypothetical protein